MVENKKPSKDDLLTYFQNHMRETIAYVLLLVGILLLFFYNVYGGIIVGIIAGIYFGDDIINRISQAKNDIAQSKGIPHHLIAAGIAVAFFIEAPAIFLGAAIAIGVKQLFIGPEEHTS